MVQDSRSASYPGAAIASSYDFGSIDFFLQAVCLSSVSNPSVRPISEFVLFRDTCPPEKLTGAAMGICVSNLKLNCARRRL